MVQGRSYLRFTLESPAQGRVGELPGEKFNRDRTVEFGIDGAVHNPHPALAQLSFQAIGSNQPAEGDRLARGQRRQRAFLREERFHFAPDFGIGILKSRAAALPNSMVERLNLLPAFGDMRFLPIIRNCKHGG